MKIAYSEIFAHQLPKNHRFPMLKYELIPEQLLYEGTISKHQFIIPNPVESNTLLLTHSKEYLNKLNFATISPKEMRKIGFPYSKTLIKREEIITQGTIDVSLSALQEGIGFNIAGGTHHAYADSGEGFCIYNDIACASNFLLKNNLVNKILVIDLDVHQGNGTAKIFSNNPNVFTFSVHGKNNYPLHKEQSDLDIGVADGINDYDYLEILNNTIPKLIKEIQPDFIFYQSGVDILNTDKLGKLNISLQGCLERDKLVLNQAYSNNIPITCVMGGGYSEDIKIIVEAHCNLYRYADYLYA